MGKKGIFRSPQRILWSLPDPRLPRDRRIEPRAAAVPGASSFAVSRCGLLQNALGGEGEFARCHCKMERTESFLYPALYNRLIFKCLFLPVSCRGLACRLLFLPVMRAWGAKKATEIMQNVRTSAHRSGGRKDPVLAQHDHPAGRVVRSDRGHVADQKPSDGRIVRRGFQSANISLQILFWAAPGPFLSGIEEGYVQSIPEKQRHGCV